MINSDQEKLLLDLRLKRISYGEFKDNFGVVPYLLPVALKNRDAEFTATALSYYFRTGFDTSMCPELIELLLSDFHTRHEDLARVLQFDVRCPAAAPALAEAIRRQFAYLDEMGDYYPFVRKCLYALSTLRTQEAVAYVREFAADPDPEISRLAQHQLDENDNFEG